MGEIIKFPVEKVKRETGTRHHTQDTAEIVMFEGVRYFREDASKNIAGAGLLVKPKN